MDLGKFKQSLQRASDFIERWFTLQEAAGKLLSNAGNVLLRLPVLSEASNFAMLPKSRELQRMVIDKQTRALEAIFGRLQANMAELESIVRGLERLAVDTGRLLGEVPSAGACAAVQSGGLSIAQIVECIEDVWRICRDDLAVRAAALASLSHTSSPQHFAEVSAAVQAHTGLRPGSHLLTLLQSAAAALR